MHIRFTKVSLVFHKLEIIRSDGSRQEAALETKTFMPHDLIHFVYEKEAGLSHSFWGSIASGMSFADFDSSEKVAALMKHNDELRQTEMATGILAGYLGSSLGEASAL